MGLDSNSADVAKKENWSSERNAYGPGYAIYVRADGRDESPSFLRQLTTTPYHPMCNGLVERFNGTLKQILRRLCADRPKDWDKCLSAALFAYRDATQESLGFLPFKLVYGRTVRGPMTIFREVLTKEVNDPEVHSTYQYIVDLKERIESTCTMAKENLEKATQRYRVNYNKRTKKRDMKRQ